MMLIELLETLRPDNLIVYHCYLMNLCCMQFLYHQLKLNQQDQLLLLSGQIIDYIKKGQAIRFLYEKKGVVAMRQVAPL